MYRSKLPIQAEPVIRTDVGDAKNFQIQGSFAAGIDPSCTCDQDGNVETNTCGSQYTPRCYPNYAINPINNQVAYSCNCVKSRN